jgi:DNA-binding CsgD family transcriptional regulator
VELVSKEVEKMLGYHPLEFNLSTLFENVHPDDHADFLNFEHKTKKFLAALPVEKLMNYKIKCDYRIKKKNGDYVRVLQQSIVLEHDEYGRIIRTLVTHTNVTHLKPEGKPVFSITGIDDEPVHVNSPIEKTFSVSKEKLSRREKQILLLLSQGKPSKEIGEILNISKQTVDKHRKNMIGKNNFKNTAELISNAIKNGWL